MIQFSKEKSDCFLEVNSIKIDATNEEIAETGLAVAAGTMKYEALLKWVIDHRT